MLPALGKTNSRPGAAVFAAYWFRALDWGYATTDSTLAKSLYLPACTDCARFMRTFDAARASGQSFRGGRLRPMSQMIVSDDSRHPGAIAVDVVVAQTRLRTIERDGTTLGVDPAVDSIRYRVWLERAEPAWAVLDYKRVVVK